MSTPTARTVTQVVTKVIGSATPSSTVRAAPQGGILEGGNPSVYQMTNPIIVFIIQAGIIIIFCRLVHVVLGRFRQPRVIAEVIGGILLGPSVCGHIPHFTTTIFPTASMPTLNTAANLGLILFLFLVGLEVDLRFIKSNWRPALSVGALGMILPFGLGFAVAYGLYHQFRTDSGLVPIQFGTYMLFIGVAMAITAFPVLCRILTELKLLHTPVGIIVLSAGVGNDVIGWILLALCVALVNAGSGLTALWVLLTAVGYALLLTFGIKPAFLWYLRRTGSIDNGPQQSVVAVTLLLVLASAFFTGVIGIHPIFGAFMVGLICPHEGGFAIKMTEKVEDVVTTIFLPLYFALSGLSTNLGLLDDGITWGYVFAVIFVAFFAKITGGTLAARFNGMVWRESFTIGVLMSCKGLVELIVLNIGLSAKILSQRTFTIFVLMALITTFATTPLTSLLYPRWYQIKIEAWKRGEIDWDDNRLELEGGSPRDSVSFAKMQSSEIRRILTYVRVDSMSAVLKLSSLLALNPDSVPEVKVHPTKEGPLAQTASTRTLSKMPLQLHAVRLMELTDRESSVMKVSEIDEYTTRDPILNTVRTFGQLNQIAVAGAVVVTPETSYATSLTDKVSDIKPDLLVIPWSGSGTMSENQYSLGDGSDQRFSNSTYSHFVASALQLASSNVAIFVDRGFGGSNNNEERVSALRTHMNTLSLGDPSIFTAPLLDQGHHIFFPYYGSEDDKAALRFVLQLAQNPTVTATIVHYTMQEARDSESVHRGAPEVTLSEKTTSVALTSRLPGNYATFFSSIRDSLPSDLASRVVFETVVSTTPLRDTMEKAAHEVGRNPMNAGDLIVLGRNWDISAALAAGMNAPSPIVGSEAKRSLGIMAEGAIGRSLPASLLVMAASDGTNGGRTQSFSL